MLPSPPTPAFTDAPTDCAGTHLLVDFWGAKGLDDQALLERVLREAVTAARATLLHLHLHQFGSGGVSGVAILAESHITVHSWPELGYAAFDVFMCGNANPHHAVEALQVALQPQRVELQSHRRGSACAGSAGAA